MFDRLQRISLAAGVLAIGFGAAAVAQPCEVPDDGSGTVFLPPDGCGYLSPQDVHIIIDGLPPGTTIEVAAEHFKFFNKIRFPGGDLGGEVEQFDSILSLEMTGTGDLTGFQRSLFMQVQCETHTGPRNPGDPVQSFPNDMFLLQGQIFGDPDFDFLAIAAGTGFGLPSPGQTTLTDLGNGNFNVDSFFDITYTIDFQGAPGSILEGFGGATTATVRMQAGEPAPGGSDCEFDEDFDDYPAGSQIVGQGGWEPWAGDPLVGDGIVVPNPALSLPHALEIDGADDIVHQFSGINSGRWKFRARQFIPDTFSGETWFILLNEYFPAANSDWSLQLAFNSTTGVVRDGNGTATLPLLIGTWVEIEVCIDLDLDLLIVRYNGEHLFTDSWRDHVDVGGDLNIAAVDLFASNASPVYYDELSLCPAADPCPTDIDGDGITGFNDLIQVLASWGPYAPCPPFKATDINKDCEVGFVDLLEVLARWGPCAVCESPNEDPFATLSELDAPTQIEFGSPVIPPLPPDFFFPGSPPVVEQIPLAGFLDPDGVDTRVRRSGPLNFPGAGFPRPSEPVSVEIIQLDLVGAEPINVGGQPWLVAMGLADNQQPGVLDAILESPAGGSTQAVVPVKPRLIFAPEQDLQLLDQGLIQPEDVQLRLFDFDQEGLPPVDMGWDEPFPFSTTPALDGGFFNGCELQNPFPFFPGVPPGGGAGPHGGGASPAAPGLPPHIAAGGPGHLHYVCPPPPPPPGLCTYSLIGATGCFFGGGGGQCPAPPLGKILRLCPQGAPCPVPPCPPFIIVIFPCQPPGTGFCVGFYRCIGCQGC